MDAQFIQSILFKRLIHFSFVCLLKKREKKVLLGLITSMLLLCFGLVCFVLLYKDNKKREGKKESNALIDTRSTEL